MAEKPTYEELEQRVKDLERIEDELKYRFKFENLITTISTRFIVTSQKVRK